MPDSPESAKTTPAAKAALRSRLLTRRQLLSAEARGAAAVAVQAATIALVRRSAPFTTAAYVPVGTEPGGADLPAVLAGALPPAGRLLLPVLLPDGDLDWARYEGTESLVAGPRGLWEAAG